MWMRANPQNKPRANYVPLSMSRGSCIASSTTEKMWKLWDGQRVKEIWYICEPLSVPWGWDVCEVVAHHIIRYYCCRALAKGWQNSSLSTPKHRFRGDRQAIRSIMFRRRS